MYFYIDLSKHDDLNKYPGLYIERIIDEYRVESRLLYKTRHLATLINDGGMITIDLYHKEAFEDIFESERPPFIRVHPNINTFDLELSELFIPWKVFDVMHIMEHFMLNANYNIRRK